MDESPIESQNRQKVNPADAIYAAGGNSIINLTFFNSSIANSEQERQQVPLVASSPQLVAPQWSCCLLHVENQMAKISLMMGQAWGKSIEEIEEEIKKELVSAPYQEKEQNKQEQRFIAEVAIADRYAWLEAMAAVMRAIIEGSGNHKSEDQVESIESSSSVPLQSLFVIAPDALLFQNVALIAGSSAIAKTMHIESKVIEEAWRALTPSEDFLARKVGLFTALWGVGLVYQLSAEKLWTYGAKDLKQKGQEKDLDFAKTYVERVLGSLEVPLFTITLQNSLGAATGQSVEKGDAQLQTLVSKAKLVLLSLALALLVKLELKSRQGDEGWINELDFAGLLTGKVDLTKNDVHGTASLKRALLDEMRLLLAALEPEDRNLIVYHLLEYMSKNPPVEELLDQQTVFNQALKPPPSEVVGAA